MKKIIIFTTAVTSALLFICSGFAYSGQKAKWGMPEKVSFGRHELKLIWQKDFSKEFEEGTEIGSYGGIGSINMSENAQFIAINLHSKKGDNPKSKPVRGVFHLLNKKGDVLWSKRLKAHKQRGFVSKNGKTVLLDSITGKWATEYYTYETNGKLIHHGKDQLLGRLSGNGEYILFFAIEIGSRAFLYDKYGRISWQYDFETDYPNDVKIMNTGDVIIFDGDNILCKAPGGRQLWKIRNPAIDPKKSSAPYTFFPWQRVFEIPHDATSQSPYIVVHCQSLKTSEITKISLINPKGNIISEITGEYDLPDTVSPKASIITGIESTATDNFIWIWDTKKDKFNKILMITEASNFPSYSENVAVFQGAFNSDRYKDGIDFAYQLLLVDIKNLNMAKIPSYDFTVSHGAKYLLTSFEDGRTSLYTIGQK